MLRPHPCLALCQSSGLRVSNRYTSGQVTVTMGDSRPVNRRPRPSATQPGDGSPHCGRTLGQPEDVRKLPRCPGCAYRPLTPRGHQGSPVSTAPSRISREACLQLLTPNAGLDRGRMVANGDRFFPMCPGPARALPGQVPCGPVCSGAPPHSAWVPAAHAHPTYQETVWPAGATWGQARGQEGAADSLETPKSTSRLPEPCLSVWALHRVPVRPQQSCANGTTEDREQRPLELCLSSPREPPDSHITRAESSRLPWFCSRDPERRAHR